MAGLRSLPIILPVRDVVGRIIGLKVRRSSYEGKDKYVWVTSAGKPGGTAARAAVHYARPDLVRQRGSAIITEGVLKADVISEQMQCAVVGLPGADTFRPDFGRTLRASIPELQSVFVAYDADYRTNEHVRAALLRLIGTLEGAGLAVSVLKWNPTQGKGFDDLLLNESGVKA